jgi:hypothetical protein
MAIAAASQRRTGYADIALVVPRLRPSGNLTAASRLASGYTPNPRATKTAVIGRAKQVESTVDPLYAGALLTVYPGGLFTSYPKVHLTSYPVAVLTPYPIALSTSCPVSGHAAAMLP